MITLNFSLALDNFSLSLDETIPSSGITAIFGRSGAGKTSLINAISGLSVPDTGKISVGESTLFDAEKNIKLPPEKRRIGYVFQDARLFPHMSVEKNLRYGQSRANPSMFEEITQLLGIGELLARYPRDLSGGEKQRVAIGRALLSEPELLIMDEPTASLDGPRRQELISYLLRLTESLSIPMIYVSHSLDEILQLADHMLLLNKGRVIANGSLHDVWSSEHMQPWLSVKEQSALVTATVVGTHPRYAMSKLDLEGETLWVPAVEAALDSRLRLRVFANDISIVKTPASDTSIRNVLPCFIESVVRAKQGEMSTGYCQVMLRMGNEVLIANITEWAADELALSTGDKVFAQLKGISIAKSDLAQHHSNF
ncbi:molybdenum ABC transporter ATP-binding protein ModC [Enterovibrio norvegicus]|uniref:molybdenum ABC transporter ATP-binding protein ModC n=1 Tax=Enterovibrio norvegicus TaxID=188144 RepID=UPI000C83E98B|nr:molybdenum ABC transporter ATP-binding protein ModC [Enterovibrio norvegicus]PML78688.1 molybdenum ABC transporter ATP-binding protein [Enterovibrio norvegicus]